ncbi:MAG: LamG-like jellyroll fold domain-containing protein [Akkermansia sp.]
MNKILPSILLSLASGCAFAATTMTDDLHPGLKYWWDFQQDTKPIDYTSGSPVTGSAWGEDFALSSGTGYGTLGGSNHPYKANPGLKANSFTLSFDIKDLSTADWKDLFSIHTDGGTGDTNKLCLEKASGNTLSLFPGNFGGTDITGNISCSYTPSDWTTFTITCTGSLLSLYKDGLLVGNINCTIGDEAITGIQFGQDFGGGRPITSAKIDNVGLWNTALTADQVKSLNGLVPEPTTVSLSLVGLAALMLRRRRA